MTTVLDLRQITRDRIRTLRRHRFRNLRCAGGSPQCLHTNDPDDYPHPFSEWLCWGCWLWMHPLRRSRRERRLFHQT